MPSHENPLKATSALRYETNINNARISIKCNYFLIRPECLRATITSSIILPAFTFSFTINWVAAAGYIFGIY